MRKVPTICSWFLSVACDAQCHVVNTDSSCWERHRQSCDFKEISVEWGPSGQISQLKDKLSQLVSQQMTNHSVSDGEEPKCR